MQLTGKIKTVKVKPIVGNVPPKYRNLPNVLMAAIKNIYNHAWPIRQVEAGHWRMETFLCSIDYTVPAKDGRYCLMRAYRKREATPDTEPFCVAQYKLEE